MPYPWFLSRNEESSLLEITKMDIWGYTPTLFRLLGVYYIHALCSHRQTPTFTQKAVLAHVQDGHEPCQALQTAGAKIKRRFQPIYHPGAHGPGSIPPLVRCPGGHTPKTLLFLSVTPTCLHFTPACPRVCPQLSALSEPPKHDCGTTKRTAHTMQTNTALCRP